ncbi:hypothetical protein L202_00892 [Cryptococcus amylolentus CBS 6039]|uniref:Ku C-terminal domain-containing protein n=1 Tax=Cryptococcus amylolentus CBS 6039 TaxID=1295533 RepID=A0A1E3I907_9TREE|nr:hypothetical protein L202_00892 [Cryptococcus amylolentus CBS 6039]ODN85064.1 hypothetical protein L202_00892 [Cryptococcus amylolentus CBS 6039]
MKKKKNQKQELGEGEGYEQAGATTKPETISQRKADSQPGAQTASQPKPTVPTSEPTLPGKPKPGRIISNESPIADFRRVIKDGDVFRKAIQDMGEVVRENVAASFSRQAFPVAIECLALMRETALEYERWRRMMSKLCFCGSVLTDGLFRYVESLEKVVKGPGLKHLNFWQEFEKAGQSVSKISEEEAEAALNGEDREPPHVV